MLTRHLPLGETLILDQPVICQLYQLLLLSDRSGPDFGSSPHHDELLVLDDFKGLLLVKLDSFLLVASNLVSHKPLADHYRAGGEEEQWRRLWISKGKIRVLKARRLGSEKMARASEENAKGERIFYIS